MRLPRWFLPVCLIISCSSLSRAATVTGTVKGPDGTAFRAAFVEAQNTKTNITVAVLSDTQGHYRIENLPAGEYRLFIRAVGYKADPRTGVTLTANQNASFDFALEKGTVRWSDISGYQGKQFFPPGNGRGLMIKSCSTCHEFQNLMVPLHLDANGWTGRVGYMKTLGAAGGLTNQQITELSSYLASLFGPDSVLPKSPADKPGYKETVQSFSNDALKIVYVEYAMPGPRYFPFSAAPDKTGHLWIPDRGVANRITRLDPNTGEMQDFWAPNVGPALIHSAVPAPDGTVWIAESVSHKLAKWDPKTQKITEYQDNYKLPPQYLTMGYKNGGEGLLGVGIKHTVRIDPSGNVWCSGVPLTKFDPKTEKFTHLDQATHTYDVKPDKNGDVWFTNPEANEIGKVDGKTMKVSLWVMPTPKSFPRRMAIGPDGMIWVGEAGFPFGVGKIARFDPKTQTFKEYPLPGPDPSPYALDFDADGYLWYDSHYMDVLGRFDTETGKVTEYPFPHSEITMREFFRDAQGRMWYGSSSNDVVGYFYLAGKSANE